MIFPGKEDVDLKCPANTKGKPSSGATALVLNFFEDTSGDTANETLSFSAIFGIVKTKSIQPKCCTTEGNDFHEGIGKGIS